MKCLIKRPDNIFVEDFCSPGDLQDAYTRNGWTVLEHVLQSAQHRWNAAGSIEVFHVVLPARNHISDVRGLFADLIEGLQLKIYPCIMSYSGDMKRRICRSS